MVLVTSETKLTSCIIKNLKKFDISMDSFSIDEYSVLVVKKEVVNHYLIKTDAMLHLIKLDCFNAILFI